MSSPYCAGLANAVDWHGDQVGGASKRALVRRVFAYFRPYRAKVLLSFALLAVQALLALVPAVVIKSVIDYLTSSGSSFAHLAWLVGLAVAATVGSGLASIAQSYLSNRISQGVMSDLRGQLFGNLIRQSATFFTHNRTGELMSRMSNDVYGIQDVVSSTLFGFASNLLIAATTLTLMFGLDWRLTALTLLVFPVAFIPAARAGRAIYRARGHTQSKVGQMNAYMQEVLNLSGMLLVKVFARERSERARLGRLNEELRRLEIKQAMIGRWLDMHLDVLQAAGPVLLLLAGGWLVINDYTTIGAVFVLATVLTQRLYQAVSELAAMQANVTGSLALFSRLFEYIDRVPEVGDRDGARELVGARGAIELENVTFSYDEAAEPALHGVSLAVDPGQLVALVGPSGAGKTSLAYLVARLYDPQQGCVRIDGHDLRELTLESLGQHVGVVFQDTFLFHTTVRENLLFAKEDATDEQIEAAARAAHVHDVIAALPAGYDTVLGERGHRLSGGEKQRLALARVILKDPAILILDEATSNLDSLSEALIQAALAPLLSQRTSLVIAHRLSTVRAAGKIVVLEGGRIVEQGTHRDLVAAGGVYTRLYERQFTSVDQAVGQPI